MAMSRSEIIYRLSLSRSSVVKTETSSDLGAHHIVDFDSLPMFASNIIWLVTMSVTALLKDQNDKIIFYKYT